MLKTRGDVFITIRSRDLISTAVGDNNNSGRFNLFEDIIADDDEILGVELVSATIPNSFYNLSNNNSNNTITFKEGANAYTTITIPSGSYDILELSDKLKTLLEAQSTTWGNSYTYTFSYDKINNLLTITNSGNDAVFDFTIQLAVGFWVLPVQYKLLIVLMVLRVIGQLILQIHEIVFMLDYQIYLIQK